jgi:hypothetical protein
MKVVEFNAARVFFQKKKSVKWRDGGKIKRVKKTKNFLKTMGKGCKTGRRGGSFIKIPSDFFKNFSVRFKNV